MMKYFIQIICFFGLFVLFANCRQSFRKQSFPNIIIFLADDMGYGDLGCYGSTDINTPNIDKLAEQGVRFTNFYSNGPECTPTRVALMTGRYQQRAGGLECAVGAGNVGRYDEAVWLAEKQELGLPVSENTLIKHLKSAGFQTAIFGKWHLGYEKKFRPGKHGFDHSFGPIGYGGDYFYHTEQVETGMEDLTGMHTLMENNKEVFYTGKYLTGLLSEKAVEWLKSRNNDQPFFLYMPYTAPHTPYQGPNDMIDRPLGADEWNTGTRETYVEMVESLDSGIGSILDYLTENQMDEETLIIFFSDNGGTKKADNGPFSGNKGSVYEGGIHVPCIIRWPGKIQPGLTSNQTCISFDLTKSILNLLNEKIADRLDGYDILSHELEKKDDVDRKLFWRLKRGNWVQKAIRNGDFKYVARSENDTLSFEKLYDLKTDPGEEIDLSSQFPDKLNDLRNEMDNWENDVKAPRLENYFNFNH